MTKLSCGIPCAVIEEQNKKREKQHLKTFKQLGEQLYGQGINIETITKAVMKFSVTVPSWGLNTGGTRFGRFPIPGEPRTIYEKLDDAAVIQQLTACTPSVSLHIPWDAVDNPAELKAFTRKVGLQFDAMNSNTFQDQSGQKHSYKFGSLCHTQAAVRQQAVAHNLECIEIGKRLGSKSLSVWLADGSCFPGQMHFRRSLERTLDSLLQIYKKMPSDWKMFIEYKPFEPAFYGTVIPDWGTAWMLAVALGGKASCLVDLGHHLPNTNIEQVVSRLIQVEKLGGFHFNDSKFSDDDLSSGSIKPYQLFLIFNELVDAAADKHVRNFKPAYLIDQSHNLKDPIEDLMQSANELQRAYTKALLVDRRRLNEYQTQNDVVMAELTLKKAFETDVTPIIQEARRCAGAAIDPIATYRASCYRQSVAKERSL